MKKCRNTWSFNVGTIMICWHYLNMGRLIATPNKLTRSIMFNLHLDLGESYVYGQAVVGDISYRVNIQVGNQSIIFPSDIEIDTDQALIYFDMGEKDKIVLNSNVTKGNRDMIELYVNDETMQNLANVLPVSMTMAMDRTSKLK